MTLPENVIQPIILAGAAATWWFLTKRDANKRKWGFVIMILTQPLWWITSSRHDQWAIQIISFIYMASAIRGIWTHFIVKES